MCRSFAVEHLIKLALADHVDLLPVAATLQGILDLGAVVVVLPVAARRSDDNHVRRASDRLVADYGPWARAASGRATGKRFARFKIAVSV